MTRRSLAVRLVLVVSALATVATSAPKDFTLTDVAERTLEGGPSRIAVLANRAAVNNADRVSLAIDLITATGTPPTLVTIIPDDPSLPPETIEVGLGFTAVDHDLTALCVRDRDCSAGVTVEIPAGRSIAVIATATVLAYADTSFFPEDRSFPDDATVAIEVEP
jgi:hypothetical protein